MSFLRKFFNRPLVNLNLLAAGLLVEAYGKANVDDEETIRAYAKVRYLDLCSKYGLPREFTQEVEDMVASQYRPDISYGLALFE